MPDDDVPTVVAETAKQLMEYIGWWILGAQAHVERLAAESGVAQCWE
jgi:hypothetical protein